MMAGPRALCYLCRGTGAPFPLNGDLSPLQGAPDRRPSLSAASESGGRRNYCLCCRRRIAGSGRPSLASIRMVMTGYGRGEFRRGCARGCWDQPRPALLRSGSILAGRAHGGRQMSELQTAAPDLSTTLSSAATPLSCCRIGCGCGWGSRVRRARQLQSRGFRVSIARTAFETIVKRVLPFTGPDSRRCLTRRYRCAGNGCICWRCVRPRRTSLSSG